MADEDSDSVEITHISSEKNPGQVWSVEKVNAAHLKRPLIEDAIRKYKEDHPTWEQQPLLDVSESIAKAVKQDCPRLVTHVVRNIIWTVLSSSISGSCQDPAKKDEHEKKVVQELCRGLAFGDRVEGEAVSSDEEEYRDVGLAVLCPITMEINNTVNGNSVLLECEDVPLKLVERVRKRYVSLRVQDGGAVVAATVGGENVDIVAASAVDGSEIAEQRDREDREGLFNRDLEVGRVSTTFKAEVEDAKSLMPIAECTAESWCALCHWCGNRQALSSGRCTFHRRGCKEWFLSYQGVLLLMYRLAPDVFDSIRSSSTASSALKRKLGFLVSVFNAPGAAITLAEVHPEHVTARYRSMTAQDGFRMNASSLKTLLTSFRICFNVARVEAGQRQAAVRGQQSFEQAAKRKSEFANLRNLNLFQKKRTLDLDVEDVGPAAPDEGGSSSEEGERHMWTVHGRNQRLVDGIQKVFRSFAIDVEKEEISSVFAENQRDPATACLVLERRYWGQAVFAVGGVVEAKYLRGPHYYRAKIVAQEAEGKFEIEWVDTDPQDRMKTKRDFRFPRIRKDEWKKWVGSTVDLEFPEFSRKFNTFSAMN